MSSDRERVAIGVVGLGYWGPNLARNILESPRAELRWLCDVDPTKLASTAARYPTARATTQIEELLDDPHLDAVAISTPISSHYALTKAFLEAGKHAFVEKPLALSSHEARELIECATRSQLVLLPGHTFLYSPPIVKIKEIIDSGEIGDLYFISMSRVNLGLHQPNASVIWDLAPHDFSILRYWLGELPVEVTAMARDCVLPDTPDVAFVNMRFARGVIAHLELSWLSPSKLRRTAIVGSRKMIVYDDISNEPIRVFDSGAMIPDPETFGEFRLAYWTGDIVSLRVEATEPLSLEVADFCSAILEGTSPRATAEIGMEVVLAIEAVERSLAASGAPSTVLPAQSRPGSAAAREDTTTVRSADGRPPSAPDVPVETSDGQAA